MPPTKSTGTPASSNAFSTPMCEQPLQGRGALVTGWEPLWLHPQESPFSNSLTGQEQGAGPTPMGSHPSKPHPSGTAPASAGHTPHLAPPPPSTRAMVLPVSTRARREKSLCRSTRLENTFSYSSCWDENRDVP